MNTGPGSEGRKSVRKSGVVIYDGEERRPVERNESVNVNSIREVGGWRM